MPGMYRPGEYDLAGCIVGVVDRSQIIDGSKVRIGDVVLGLPSNGLHTNGYSLARKILFEKLKLKLSSRIPGVRGSVGDELLRVHKNYQPLLTKVPPGMIRGLAHITGGGLIDNIPRVLPKNCDAVIDARSWRVPEIFKFIGEEGNIDGEEMYQVFNMGIGMVAIVTERDIKRRSRSCTRNESAGSNTAAEKHGFFTCHPERSRGIPQCYLEVPQEHPSVRAGLALSIGMAISGARQAKKDKSEAGIHEGNLKAYIFPGFLGSRFPCKLSFPVIRDIPVIRG